MTRDEQLAAIKANDELIAAWLEPFYAVPPTGYAAIQDLRTLPDGKSVEQNSVDWAGRFFTELANPYNPVLRTERRVHFATPTTVDILRHDYAVGDASLRVLETVNFFLTQVETGLDILKIEPHDRPGAINKMAHLLLKMEGTCVGPNLASTPYSWVFRFPDRIEEGTRFSTHPEKNPSRMWSWVDRLDGGVRDGHLYFLQFKKAEATSGKSINPDGQHWFDGKCRDAYQPKQAP